MARTKKLSKPKTRLGDDISEANPGDYCYFLNGSNRPVFSEIIKVLEERGMLVFQLMCQTDYKFIHVPAMICSFEEKQLKGKKRADLCPEVYNVK